VAAPVGELDDVAAGALDGGGEDPDLAAPDLGVGADVHDGVGRGGELHGEGPHGGAAEAVPGGVAEHDGAHEQHQLVDDPRRDVVVWYPYTVGESNIGTSTLVPVNKEPALTCMNRTRRAR